MPAARSRGAAPATLAVCSVLCLAAILGLLLRTHMGPRGELLSQFTLRQLVELNQITQATLNYDPKNQYLTGVTGRYWKLEHNRRVEVPFRAKVRLYPELERKLLEMDVKIRTSG